MPIIEGAPYTLFTGKKEARHPIPVRLYSLVSDVEPADFSVSEILDTAEEVCQRFTDVSERRVEIAKTARQIVDAALGEKDGSSYLEEKYDRDFRVEVVADDERELLEEYEDAEMIVNQFLETSEYGLDDIEFVVGSDGGTVSVALSYTPPQTETREFMDRPVEEVTYNGRIEAEARFRYGCGGQEQEMYEEALQRAGFER